MVQNAQAIGTEAASLLKGQTAQMENIHEQVEEIESNLNMANKQMRRYMRRLVTDKIVVCFFGLIVLGLVAIVVLHATGVVRDTSVNQNVANTVIPDDLNRG